VEAKAKMQMDGDLEPFYELLSKLEAKLKS
jgi:hypothetical protein